MLQKNNLLILLFCLVIPVTYSCKDGGKSRTDEGKIPKEDVKTSSQAQPGEVKVPLRAPEQDAPPAGTDETLEEQLLREACLQGLTAEVEKHIHSGIDPDAADEEGRTGLMLAAFNGHTDIVSMLLDHRATVNKSDFMGRTALMYASTGHFPETVEILLSKGAETNMVDNEEGFTALMFAAAEGNGQVVRLLLDHGANPDIKDIDGDNAETFARQNGHTEVADMLCK